MIAVERLIEQSARYLGGLNRSQEVINFALSKPYLVEGYLGEYDEAIEALNYLLIQGTHLRWVPAVGRLREYLIVPGGDLSQPPLPLIEKMSSDPRWRRPFIRGLREEARLLRTGEQDKAGVYLPHEKIMFATLPTTNEALMVAAIGHTYERACFAGIVSPSGHEWRKDDILSALDEVVLLGSIDNLFPRLYKMFANQPSPENGGLGWISQERVDELRRNKEAILRDLGE